MACESQVSFGLAEIVPESGAARPGLAKAEEGRVEEGKAGLRRIKGP
jgi:hypothetical protein